MVSAIIENVSRNKIDLVEIGTIGMLKYAEIAPEIPKLLIHHNVESLLFESRGRSESNPFKKLYLALQAYKMRRLERNTSGLIDYHTVVSPLDRSRLLKINPRADITVIENGVDLEYYQPSERKEEVAHLLTFTGEMSWFPNDRAMRYFFSYIWPIISRDLPEIAIDIVGASPSKWLVDLGKRNKQIRVYGFVEDVRPYVRKASLYIVPLTVGGGTRLKILEAMSMGKAIVSTTIGSEGLNVSDGHDILIAKGYKEFAQKAILALRDEQLRNRLGLNARQTEERQYSWKQIAGKLDNLYKQASAKEKN